jgi:hypothetical protein
MFVLQAKVPEVVRMSLWGLANGFAVVIGLQATGEVRMQRSAGFGTMILLSPQASSKRRDDKPTASASKQGNSILNYTKSSKSSPEGKSDSFLSATNAIIVIHCMQLAAILTWSQHLLPGMNSCKSTSRPYPRCLKVCDHR